MGNTNVRLVPPTKETRVDLKAALAAIVKDLWEVRAQLEREFPANHPVIALCAQVQKLSVMVALMESKR